MSASGVWASLSDYDTYDRKMLRALAGSKVEFPAGRKGPRCPLLDLHHAEHRATLPEPLRRVADVAVGLVIDSVRKQHDRRAVAAAHAARDAKIVSLNAEVARLTTELAAARAQNAQLLRQSTGV